MLAYLKQFVSKNKYFFVSIFGCICGMMMCAKYLIPQKGAFDVWKERQQQFPLVVLKDMQGNMDIVDLFMEKKQPIIEGYAHVFSSVEEVMVYPTDVAPLEELYIVRSGEVEIKSMESVPMTVDHIEENEKKTYLLLQGTQKEGGASQVCLTDKLVRNLGCIRLPQDVLPYDEQESVSDYGTIFWDRSTEQDIVIDMGDHWYRFDPWKEKAVRQTSTPPVQQMKKEHARGYSWGPFGKTDTAVFWIGKHDAFIPLTEQLFLIRTGDTIDLLDTKAFVRMEYPYLSYEQGNILYTFYTEDTL